MANENDVIREVADWQLADRGVHNARDESSAERKLFQKIERSRDFKRESTGCVFVSLAVPGGGLLQILLGDLSKANYGHRPRTSRSTSRRASRQSTASSGFARAS